ncbi:hydroxypyruvate isomerase [Acinetobacter sp. ANC 4558]|uniref:hydroxypyruvate isomerase family protein n=1 Tax=Acinetobacter sp. ANC 4558 TaxID=1977876 RepID=UPI000A33F215|nr:TIM barrel protein [Acinetobacter sp. ANC 4558]OTG83192.1 hydroxypyruvate isomerase [Acinetobacter sp. ANC 4558]
MYRLAVNLSMIFTEVPLIERFALAKKYGFNAVEIQFPYELKVQELRKELEKNQLHLCLINVPAGDLMQGGNGLACHPDKREEFQHALEQAIHYANQLHVPSVNILAGKQPSHLDYAICLDTLIDNLKLASALFDKYNLQPVFEMINGIDMPHFLIQNIAQAQHILAAVQHPALKIQFDCYHMQMMGENILTALQGNIDNIGHIQFADCLGRHEPDTGSIPFHDIFTWLKQSTYKGFLAAEYKPSQHSEQSFMWKNKYFSSF